MQISKRIKNGLKSVGDLNEGINNFLEPNKEIEKKALIRAKKCVSCPNYKDEPIPVLKVTDRLPELSGKMCDLCGCVLSYKLRIKTIKTENCPLAYD